jgi:hypothetical protein
MAQQFFLMLAGEFAVRPSASRQRQWPEFCPGHSGFLSAGLKALQNIQVSLVEN